MVLLQIGDQASQAVASGMGQLQSSTQKLMDMALEYAPKVLGAILVYIIGSWVIKRIARLLDKGFKKRGFDPSLGAFLRSMIKVSLMVLLVLTVISMIGVNIVSFAALLAGAGLAIGSALNGSLGNLAGGVMILILKPFKVGDLIEAQDQFGIVKEIGIVDTTILTAQNKTVHIPNGPLSTGVITNYTDQDSLRIDLQVSVSHGTNVEKARQVAIEAMKAHPNVISEPAPDVKVAQITDAGIILALWPYIRIKPYDANNPRQMEGDYYSVFFGIQEAVKTAFQQNSIGAPYGVTEVHMAKA